MADALNALAAALATSEGRQREFLLSVSHELRTPLTAITGYAESLADGVVTGDGRRSRSAPIVLAEARPAGAAGQRPARPGPARRRRTSGSTSRRSTSPRWSRGGGDGVAGPLRARPACGFGSRLPGGRWSCAPTRRGSARSLDGLAENALRVTPAGRADRARPSRADAGAAGPARCATAARG